MNADKVSFVHIPGVQLTQRQAVEQYRRRGHTDTGATEPAGIAWEGPGGVTIYRKWSEMTPAQRRLLGHSS